MDRAGKQPEARVQERGVDAIGIHVGDALMWVETARLAVLVCHRVGRDDALASPDRAHPADAEPRVAGCSLDDQPLLACLVVLYDPRCAWARKAGSM